jgi:HD-GYP domain-containing protein (c-di-GMP phosphodiesterase class II)
MRSRTTPLIMAVVAAAVGTTLMLRSNGMIGQPEHMTAIIVLCAFALVADLLLFLLPQGARGSIAVIPTLCAVLVAPFWYTVVGMAIEKVIAESFRRAEFEKAVFNVAQHALCVALAITIYVGLGGVSFLELKLETVAQITRVNGFAAFVAFITAHLTNTVLVSAVVALSTNARISSVWKANNLATIGIDIISSPIIFMLAWVYVRFGAVVAATAWVPIIGIRQLNKTNLELERTNEELLELMVKSIEARDPYTSGHSRRVHHYSMVIARAVGLGEREVLTIGRAALLHDVGKIGEKYGPILRKADRLSADEWNTMREHPSDGAQLIATMTRLRELVGPVRHHHENWDGTGYPDGLTGELIPLASRIIRFADTIDAMTTERPYRRMMSPEEVRAEIVRCRGTQFDPQMVDRLLSSPAWKTIFAPSVETSPRFGTLAVLPRNEERSRSIRS